MSRNDSEPVRHRYLRLTLIADGGDRAEAGRRRRRVQANDVVHRRDVGAVQQVEYVEPQFDTIGAGDLQVVGDARVERHYGRVAERVAAETGGTVAGAGGALGAVAGGGGAGPARVREPP